MSGRISSRKSLDRRERWNVLPVFSQLAPPSGNTYWTVGGSPHADTVLRRYLDSSGNELRQAALDAAGAQYRAVVLAAFQNVADALTALAARCRCGERETRAPSNSAPDTLVVTRHNALGAGLDELPRPCSPPSRPTARPSSTSRKHARIAIPTQPRSRRRLGGGYQESGRRQSETLTDSRGRTTLAPARGVPTGG